MREFEGTMNKIILELRNLSKTFISKNISESILKDISLSVEQNQVSVIYGKSSEEKTVLLWVLASIDKPVAGEIFLDGFPLGDPPNRELALIRRNRICLAVQDFNLIPSWTVLKNGLALPWRNLKFRSASGEYFNKGFNKSSTIFSLYFIRWWYRLRAGIFKILLILSLHKLNFIVYTSNATILT